MIKGIGIDETEIERFRLWYTYQPMRLRKIFSPDEIAYCLSIPKKSAERFAVRFSAKEAFFKALAPTGHRLSLLKICKAVSVMSNDEFPRLSVDWVFLGIKPMETHFSLSHTRVSAHAIVILENFK